MEGLLETETIALRARLEEADPIMRGCALIVMTVREDGTMEMISNVDPSKLNDVIEAFKVYKQGRRVSIN